MITEKTLEELSELRKEALEAIKKYNKIADKENFETRLGIIDATVNIEPEYDDEGNEIPSEEEIDIKARLDDEYGVYWSTEFPNVGEYAWKPSSLNC